MVRTQPCALYTLPLRLLLQEVYCIRALVKSTFDDEILVCIIFK